MSLVSAQCCCSVKKKCRSTRLPKRLLKIYVTVFICFFSSAFSLTMTFPFLPFMVEFLLPWLTEREELIGTYVGIIASAPFFGRIFASYVWGGIADIKGRKPVIVSSMLLVGLTSAVFGFSVSYEMAFIFRFLAGLFNGVVGTCKAVISEASDDSNQSLGVALLGTSFGLGIILGPAVSGFISDPIGQYNLTIDNPVVKDFLVKFPYSPPCLLSALICALSALLAALILPETLGTKRNQRSEISQSLAQTSDDLEVTVSNASLELEPDEFSQDQDNSVSAKVHDDESDNLTPTVDGQNDEEKVSFIRGDASAQRHNPLKRWSIKAAQWLKNSVKNIFTLIWNKPTGLSILCYAAFCSIDFGFNEIYSVWAKTSPHLGGLGFSLNEIGITLSVSTVLLIPIVLVLFPLLERKLGVLGVFYAQSIVLIPSIMLLPNIHYFYNTKWALWLLVCSVLLVMQVCFSLGFNCLVCFINNSVTFDKLGKVNGIGTAIAAFGRGISALLSGKLFSVSLSATAAGLGYPLDYRLVFLLFGLVFVVCVLVAACLPVSINKQKICHKQKICD